MFFTALLKKMRLNIKRKFDHGDSLYLALAFPILFTFIATFAVSRVISYFWPYIYLELGPDLHVHHYTYGIIIMALAGYLALAMRTPRGKFWVAMLHGIGMGLAMDEFAMWLHLKEDDIVRWSYDGITVTIGIFLFVFTVRPGILLLKNLWPKTWNKKAITILAENPIPKDPKISE
ncbi:MAG: hypothetical protein COV29_04360 [Candidatus Yanofskybacteria bacterium CG10_big_fil_rev_8_21_14_0_10_36_16]|uniref:Uncharacterized protein n=1 Tax=Candidatus Yanofskybacteria bacterium CG10_big_fil_rev_8_21_14_0_10_36_16 TaxID=1975096 RepID=A0A2J0Q6R8_9BACT|nr:MAG: hypothetical protein COV29_04360 [Candidatus Yanofskybacteria bacterium CG10_big_fil_rev_8_21_14_0_10_36_16]